MGKLPRRQTILDAKPDGSGSPSEAAGSEAVDTLSVKSVEDLVGTEVEWATKEVRGRYESTIRA